MPNIRLVGTRIYIRPPQKNDYENWVELRTRNLEFLRPWEPQRPASFLTRRGYIAYIAGLHANWEAGRGASFFLFNQETDQLLGGVNLNNIRRGVVQSANIGYWLGEEHTKQGYMYEALGLSLNYAFNVLNLHRIEAATLPENTPSRSVLEKIGFQEEGLARKYLCINGIWQDHVSYAILAADPRPNPHDTGLEQS